MAVQFGCDVFGVLDVNREYQPTCSFRCTPVLHQLLNAALGDRVIVNRGRKFGNFEIAK